MRKEKIFFHPIDGTGSLTISWSPEFKGDAVEAKKGSGVGFFSDEGILLSVIFDEVASEEDRQTLEFDRYFVKVEVKNGRVSHSAVRKDEGNRLSQKKKRLKGRLRK